MLPWYVRHGALPPPRGPGPAPGAPCRARAPGAVAAESFLKDLLAERARVYILPSLKFACRVCSCSAADGWV